MKQIWKIVARKDSLCVKWMNLVKLKDKSIWEMEDEKKDSWIYMECSDRFEG